MFMNIVNAIQPGNFLSGLAPDAVTLVMAEKEGFEFETNDESFAVGVGPNTTRSVGRRRYRIVRNMSATPVLGGQVVIPYALSGLIDKRTNGPQTAADAQSYVVDPDLLSAPQYALYLIVTGGITQVLNAAGANAIGDLVVSTAVSGQAATVTAALATVKQVANEIGRCIGSIGATKAGMMDIMI